jgi:hypothetical protein
METTLFKKKNSIQSSVENEENDYLVPDLNKTMINVTKRNLMMPTQKPSLKKSGKKTEILKEDIRHSQQECARCTQEISRHQK